jgi:NAD(P)H-dependent FMN reductase
MKIATLLGTSRPNNLTQHALSLAEDELKKLGAHPVRFDPAGKRLPFPGEAGSFPDAQKLGDLVRDATGVVIATPEYHGTFPAMMKLILENMGFPSGLSGKPVALLGTAAGRIGAIKTLEHLRSVCSHTGAIVLPAPISVAGVNRVFDEKGQCTDEATEQAVRSVAKNLTDYIHHHVCPAHTLEAMMRGEAAS